MPVNWIAKRILRKSRSPMSFNKEMIALSRKWLITVVIVCVVVVIGIFAFIGIKQLLSDAQSDETLGDPISEDLGDSITELFDGEVPLTEFSDQGEAFEIDETALKVIELVNEEREKAGLEDLDGPELLYEAASVRAEELEDLFSHNRPDGSLCFTVYGEFGISCKARAENIAAGQKSAEQVVEAWMNSDGHRKNILNPAYGNIGVGVYQDSNGKFYWVQLFSN